MTFSAVLRRAIKRRFLSRAVTMPGFTAIPTRLLRKYPAVLHMQQLFALLDVDCVLDVGANTGQYRDFLRDIVGYRGRIISFEPIPAHAEHLKRRAEEDSKWTIYGIALGSEDGYLDFNVMKESQFSSFHEPDTSHTQMFAKTNLVSEKLRVPVRTLDAVIEEMENSGKLLRNVYLKMDTQGFDLQVVSGARNVLPRVLGLQTEASVQPIYLGMPSYDESIRRLTKLGFVLSGIFPNNPEHFPALIEFDCFMVQSKYLR